MALSAAAAIKLMQQNPSIIKRPIFEIDGKIVTGYDQKKLDALLS